MHDSSCGRSHHLCPEETGSQSCRRGAHVAATCYYLLLNGSLIHHIQTFHKKPSTQPRSKVPPICGALRYDPHFS